MAAHVLPRQHCKHQWDRVDGSCNVLAAWSMPWSSKIIFADVAMQLSDDGEEVLTLPWAALCDMAVLTAFQQLIAS